MESSVNGREPGRGPANLPTSVTKTPICSERFVRRAEWGRLSHRLARNVASGAHAVLIMDRAAWHATSKLVMPTNITPILLPSRAPELNPVENIWQYMRANWLSNRVFENYDAIIEVICQAWNNLIEVPDTIKSIGMREWAHVGRSE